MDHHGGTDQLNIKKFKGLFPYSRTVKTDALKFKIGKSWDRKVPKFPKR